MTKYVLGLLLLLIVGIPGCYVFNWASKAAGVVTEEIDPRTILDRYEWFIEQWNAVQEQDATLNAFKSFRNETKKEYGDKPPRDVRRDMQLQLSEIRGILANRNRLAREYRSAIQKINYVPATMLPHFPESIPSYSL
tara:strand:- start:822 stop:1232 length:411 start_codon:yes stop_codon:yes gene_type:complete